MSSRKLDIEPVISFFATRQTEGWSISQIEEATGLTEGTVRHICRVLCQQSKIFKQVVDRRMYLFATKDAMANWIVAPKATKPKKESLMTITSVAKDKESAVNFVPEAGVTMPAGVSVQRCPPVLGPNSNYGHYFSSAYRRI